MKLSHTVTSIGSSPAAVLLKCSVHQEETETTRTSRDQQAVSRHAGKLVLQVCADVVEITLQEVLQARNGLWCHEAFAWGVSIKSRCTACVHEKPRQSPRRRCIRCRADAPEPGTSPR